MKRIQTSDIERIISSVPGARVSAVYKNLKSGDEALVRADDAFHAASTMKICVLMELFRQDHSGELNLEDRIVIHNEFKSIVDGSAYSLSQEDDSELTLYARFGEEIALVDLAVPMITDSSNLATNLLIEKLGASRVNSFMEKLGANGIIVRRGVEDDKAYRLGLNNEVTARGLATILASLFRGEVVTSPASKEMVRIMLGQKHRNCIPAKLPPDCRVAHKTGWNKNACHDAAIVFPSVGPPYVLVVLTNGLDEETDGPELIASISEAIYRENAQCESC